MEDMDPSMAISGQRLGQNTAYIPLSQASYVIDLSHVSDDDNDAFALLQGSQIVEDADVSRYEHYGTCRAVWSEPYS